MAINFDRKCEIHDNTTEGCTYNNSPPTMPTCPGCRRIYKKTHAVCKAGRCPVCFICVQDIGAHCCPIQQVMSLNLIETWSTLQQTLMNGRQCHVCSVQHPINKNVHGFRKFMNIDLCWDCYSIPEITSHVQDMRLQILRMDVDAGKHRCALCDHVLIDPMTLTVLRAFERDHIDVFTKISTIWELLVTGASLEQIMRENSKCRNLCVRCHSVVTCAERAVGILRLKSIDRQPPGVSPYIKKRAFYQVETLTRMLLSQFPYD
jgi:hypothetical protein